MKGIKKVWLTLMIGLLSYQGCARNTQPTENVKAPKETFQIKYMKLGSEPYLSTKAILSPEFPKHGEIAEVIVKVNGRIRGIEGPPFTAPASAENLEVYIDPERSKGIEVIGKRKYKFSIKPNEKVIFNFKVKFVSDTGEIFGVLAGGPLITEYGKIPLARGKKGVWKDTLPIFKIVRYFDEKTGRMVTKKVFALRRIEFRYDPFVREFFPPGRAEPALGPANRKIIEKMKKIEPSLSDSEALALHREIVEVGSPPNEVLKKIEKETGIKGEEVLYIYYLREGWLKALREGRIKEWRQKMKKKIRELRKNSSYKGSKGKMTHTFIGQWLYKDYIYDTTGLSREAEIKPVRKIKARVLAAYVGTDGNYHRVLTDWDVTDDAGNFSIVWTPDPPINYSSSIKPKACPIVYPSGPDPSNPLINVYDARPDTPLTASWWNDPDDPKLYRMRRGGSYTVWDTIWQVPIIDMGIVFPDTLPTDASSYESGSINIYETLLEGLEFALNQGNLPNEITKVTVKWDMGYVPPAGFISYWYNDTIFVLCKPQTPGVYDSDEWDDPVLLHEYGHHLMAHLAETPPNSGGPHRWWKAYPNRGLAYSEGWATFFSRVVRDNKLYIDTKRGIGGNEVGLWVNIEDPWINSAVPPDSFEGGPWCEGAVAGVLWDIYDGTNEIYPVYPYPDFPDTSLADSLTVGISPIWNIFDNITPPVGHHPYTIWDFLRGWVYYNYNYFHQVHEIALHHRIRWLIPRPPSSFKAELSEGWTTPVILTWSPSPDTVFGYYIYRKLKGENFFQRLNFTSDTTYQDWSALEGKTYVYAVTAVDSVDTLEFESEYSNFDTVYVPSFRTRLWIYKKEYGTTLFPPGGRRLWIGPSLQPMQKQGSYIYLTYNDKDTVFLAVSPDTGRSWRVFNIDEGSVSILSTDTQNRIWIFYLSNPDSLYYYSPYIGRTFYVAGFKKLNLFTPNGNIINVITEPDVGGIIKPYFSALIKNDTFFILYVNVEPTIDHSVFMNHLILLKYEISSGLKQYIVIDTIAQFVQSMPRNYGGINLPSITFDGDSFHISYQKILTIPINGWRWIMYASGKDLNFNTPLRIDESGKHPYISYSPIKNTVDVIYVSEQNVIRKEKDLATHQWTRTDTVFKGNSPISPSIYEGTYAVFSDLSNNFYEVYYSKFNGLYFETPVNISQTPDTNSKYPQGFYIQNLTDSSLNLVWTEGNDSIYEIRFKKVYVQPVAKFMIIAGEKEKSEFLIKRDTFIQYDSEPEKRIDVAKDYLEYKIKGLNPEKIYKIRFVYYFEPLDFSRRDRWVMHAIIDDRLRIPANIESYKIKTVTRRLPNPFYRDGEIDIKIKKIKGDFALLSMCYLYEYDKKKRVSERISGIMESENKRPKTYFLIPAISRDGIKILYGLPLDKEVEFSFYDILGRKLKGFKKGFVKAGVHSFYIKPKASGNYIIILKTEDKILKKKVFYLKR